VASLPQARDDLVTADDGVVLRAGGLEDRLEGRLEGRLG
jgi:hypothetical protein